MTMTATPTTATGAGTDTQFAHQIQPFDVLSAASPVFRQGVALFSPAIAQQILQNHRGRNRNVSDVVVRRYREDILAGVWSFAGDPIRFDVDGDLIDGQHRLAALAQIKQPSLMLPFTVQLGLAYDSIRAMDQGNKRTAGQQLSIAAIKNSAMMGAGARLALLWADGVPKSGFNKAVSTPRLDQWVRDHGHLVDHVNNHITKVRQTDLPPGAGAGAALILAQIDPDAEQEFFTLLCDGGTPKGSPINTLDRRLARLRRDKAQTRSDEYLALVFKAWNAWRKGKELRQITKLGENESFPTLV